MTDESLAHLGVLVAVLIVNAQIRLFAGHPHGFDAGFPALLNGLGALLSESQAKVVQTLGLIVLSLPVFLVEGFRQVWIGLVHYS